jgi:hypothetical protein
MPAIIVLMVALLVSCEESCGLDWSHVPKEGYVKTTSAPPPHGVIPTEVTQSGSGIGQSNYKYEWKIEFWNVGELEPGLDDMYAKATMESYYVDAPADFQGSSGNWIGNFTGGPNGDIYLTLVKGINASPKLHFKLKDGKELIKDDGAILKIDNPEAFNGWKD